MELVVWKFKKKRNNCRVSAERNSNFLSVIQTSQGEQEDDGVHLKVWMN